MWKRYLMVGAAVCMLAGISTVSRAETVSGGEFEQMETEVQGQEMETSEMPVMEQAEVSAQSASGTYAASGTYVPYEGAKYSLKYDVGRDYGLAITGITDYKWGDDLGELVIPSAIDGVAVTTIGYRAFEDCRGLTGSLTIPEGVTTIEYSAFSGCSGLTGSLTIPRSVKRIESGAFWGCSGLTGSFDELKNVPSIWDGAFSGWSGLTGSLTIPEGVTKIGDGAFAYCSGLTGNLTIPEGVTTIGMEAFRGCSGLTGSLTIPRSVASIGEYAFAGCSGLTGSFDELKNAPSIWNGAFSQWSGLTGDLIIPEGVRKISDFAFLHCSGLTGSLTIPEGVTSVGENAFAGCSGLKGSLTIPGSVTSIGNGAFAGCSGLTGSLTIPGSVSEIGSGVFSGCSGLTGSLVISKGVRKIGDRAFAGCSGLTGSLTIPESVKSIGSEAFSGCSSLTGSFDELKNIPSIWNGAFSGWSGLTGSLTIPEGVTSVGQYAFQGCSGLTGSLTIPEGVSEIGRGAFSGCSGLTGSLTIPRSVTSIDGEVFQGCSGLTGRLVIPGSVTSIGNEAFSGCSGLTGSPVIPGSVTNIGREAFSGCSGLTGNLTLPEGVRTIGEYAFSGCGGIKNIEVPTSVEILGKICGDDLKHITVLGKQTKISYNGGLGRNFVHAYSDSVVAKEAPNRSGHTLILMDPPKVREYRVSTVNELIAAVNEPGSFGGSAYSYRRIILADGLYSLSNSLNLSRQVSLTLEAEHPGKAEIQLQYGNVISVYQCADIEITGCILSNNSVQSSVKVKDSYDVKVKLYDQPVTTCTSTAEASLSVAMTTEEQKSFVAGLAAREGIAGEGATVEITISDAQDTITEQEKTQIAQTAAEGELQIGRYLDISMSLQAGESIRSITHTDTPIKLVMEIPLALRQADMAFFVIRLHDGKADLLRDLDRDPDTVTIETDRFSSYTMVYKEKTGSDSVISGTLKSFGDATKGALVQLFDSTGNVIVQTTVTGSSGAYELEVVEQGNYTLTVSKAGHVTRSYAVTLDGEALELNAEIRLKGDINGDGKADSLDKRMIFGHIAGSTTLTGYEFQVGDVDGSGRIDALDKRMIYGHIAGTSPMW